MRIIVVLLLLAACAKDQSAEVADLKAQLETAAQQAKINETFYQGLRNELTKVQTKLEICESMANPKPGQYR